MGKTNRARATAKTFSGPERDGDYDDELTLNSIAVTTSGAERDNDDNDERNHARRRRQRALPAHEDQVKGILRGRK